MTTMSDALRWNVCCLPGDFLKPNEFQIFLIRMKTIDNLGLNYHTYICVFWGALPEKTNSKKFLFRGGYFPPTGEYCPHVYKNNI